MSKAAITRWMGLLGLLAALLAGCSPPGNGPDQIIIRSVATATARPSLTPLPGTEGAPSATPGLSALPAVATDMPSAEPTAATASPTARPAVLSQWTATPIAASPNPGVHGVAAVFGFEAGRDRYAPNEKIWLTFDITNLTNARLDYGVIGIIKPDGSFHTSLSGSYLAPREVLPWRDWLSFSAPGTHALTLAMCLSPKDACTSNGQWVNLSDELMVTIE